MNYELAKELLDAEFPGMHAGSVGNMLDSRDKRIRGVPTLSELIEACGDGLVCLKRGDKGWSAYSDNTDFPDGNRLEACNWPDPETATAKLWLALHKKDD